MTERQGSAAESRYYDRLREFVDVCGALVDAGMPYAAVLLSHELFRFLYPVEPCAGFTNDRDPVGDAVARIERLLALAHVMQSAVTPYAFHAADFAPPPGADAVETSTSNLYSELWKDFDQHTLTAEAVSLLRARVPEDVVAQHIEGYRVLDMGCGSGRYTLALAALGARTAVGVDVQAKSFAAAAAFAREHGIPAEFREANVLALPFPDASFDFVFCNGVIHHSRSIEQGLTEIARVLKPAGAAFLYLYAAGGIFWRTRSALRAVFERIPLAYTKAVLRLIGMPSNRFIFCDTWYVPIETHTTTGELQELLGRIGFSYTKVPGRNPFDLDGIVEGGRIPGARAMWGDGEHRYILRPVASRAGAVGAR